MKTIYTMNIIWDDNNVTIDAAHTGGDDPPPAILIMISHHTMALETHLRTLVQNTNMSKLMGVKPTPKGGPIDPPYTPGTRYGLIDRKNLERP